MPVSVDWKCIIQHPRNNGLALSTKISLRRCHRFVKKKKKTECCNNNPITLYAGRCIPSLVTVIIDLALEYREQYNTRDVLEVNHYCSGLLILLTLMDLYAVLLFSEQTDLRKSSLRSIPFDEKKWVNENEYHVNIISTKSIRTIAKFKNSKEYFLNKLFNILMY